MGLSQQIHELDPVKPREEIIDPWSDKPTGYFDSDLDWMEENRWTAIWLLENFEDIKDALFRLEELDK